MDLKKTRSNLPEMCLKYIYLNIKQRKENENSSKIRIFLQDHGQFVKITKIEHRSFDPQSLQQS